jgi:hypothetical protein
MSTSLTYACLRRTDAFAVPDETSPAVAVFAAEKRVTAKERFSVDGRRWLFIHSGTLSV